MKQLKQPVSLILLSCLLAMACSDKQDAFILPSDDEQSTKPWYELAELYDFDRNTIFVQSGESIQEAINVANGGDVIYIEPGTYSEALTIEKENIQLIGIFNDNQKVILQNPGSHITAIKGHQSTEVINIEPTGFANDGVSIESLNSQSLKGRRSHMKMNRKHLGGNIYHYTFNVQMGYGEYDKVIIHRVIKEQRPYRALKTKGNIFMVHGAIQDFEDIFLKAGALEINEQTSAPYYLAQHGIDVWGIDLAWTKVPMEPSDFSLMKEWGVSRDIHHTLTAMTFARFIRGFTGQGFKKMNLLGFSYGVSVAYGAASLETQQHRICRDIKGLIPVDSEFKGNPKNNESACSVAASHMALINDGMYHYPWGVGFIQLASMTMAAPDDMSTISGFEGLTNLQMMMAIGSGHDGTHFHGGNPFGFTYTDPMRFVRLGTQLSPHMPRLAFYEMVAVRCPDLDVNIDDYIHKIKVPIFFITAEGGAGPMGNYTTSLTKSKDIEWLNINDPKQDTETDFGHADLWMAYQASEWVWKPLKLWLLKH
ncbi:hypothetical protein [Carboxylicivirga marina]|uniref:hypothetical protein n=1 Tax=Carboxylicivirga marina TaxID=2800988 RepID=UPI00259AA981|nr:hypothetical protein [uncultured Carboxylicivirga sp.]